MATSRRTLYAECTGQFEKWKELRRAELKESPEWMDRLRGEGVTKETSPDMLTVIDYWKQFKTVLDGNAW